MAIKVGHIPDLNCEPFYFDMERRGIELHDMLPSGLAAALENGEIDAGPIPLVDYFRLEDHIQPLSGFCIASVNKAASSNLYSKQPIRNLEGARIGVTNEDSTSLSLLQVLLSLKHQVQPEAYVGLEDSYDAFLLTGNQGLRRRRGNAGVTLTNTTWERSGTSGPVCPLSSAVGWSAKTWTSKTWRCLKIRFTSDTKTGKTTYTA